MRYVHPNIYGTKRKFDMYIQKNMLKQKEGGEIHPLVVLGVDTRHFVQQVRAGRGGRSGADKLQQEGQRQEREIFPVKK